MLVFLLDVFLAGVAQAALPLCFAALTALLGVLLAVCKIVIGHLGDCSTQKINV